ncbi:MAG TPA: FixH family protein [Polyangiaceae bacterium]|jgi:hypothetical protein
MPKLHCLTAALLWASVACSSPNPGSAATGTFPADAYTTIASTSGALLVAVRTSPQPPSVGTNEVQLTITHASDGTPVDGLTLAVEPWMPSMGHGTSTTTITPEGDGVYLVTSVYLYMQGVWALRTTVSGPMSDDAAPQLVIQ